jgi:hypothetical protein
MCELMIEAELGLLDYKIYLSLLHCFVYSVFVSLVSFCCVLYRFTILHLLYM